MTRLEMIKTLAGGFVIGAIVISIVGFSADWVVTKGTHDQEVRAAWIDGQAKVCASLVRAHREATGDASELSGWKARDARDELAKSFAVILPGQETVDPAVIRACSNMLDRRDI